MISEIEEVDLKPATSAVIRLTIQREAIQQEMTPAINEILAEVKSQELTLEGAMFAHHLTRSDTHFDVEVGFPTSAKVTSSGRVCASELPSGRAAKVTYEGGYENLYEAWRLFNEQFNQASLKTSGDTIWEVYSVGPESGLEPNKWCTDLYLPIQ